MHIVIHMRVVNLYCGDTKNFISFSHHPIRNTRFADCYVYIANDEFHVETHQKLELLPPKI